MMKRLITFLLIVVMCITLFSCGKSDAAKACEKLIKNIGQVSLESEDAIILAENAYDALSVEEKDQISKSAQKLTDIRNSYNELVIQKKVNDVTNIILAIGEVSLNSEDAIIAAETAYETLTNEEKDRITESGKILVNSRITYNELVIQKKVNDVSDIILAIGEITLDSEDAITAAETAYNTLSDEEKERISENGQKLTDYRNTYKELVIEHHTDIVIELINAIGTVTTNSEKAIIEAEKAFSELTEEEKLHIADSEKKLKELRTTYETVVKQAHANVIVKKINAIGTVTIDSESKIHAAETAYNKLTADEKKLVNNYSILTSARQKLQTLVSAEKQKVINEYSKKFDIETDPITNISWYTPKTMPNYIDIRSYIIPYIGVQGNNVWICIRYNYTADSWIFWKNLTIKADNEKYYLFTSYGDTTRDNDTEVWEFYDECLDTNASMDSARIKMLQAIANSQQTIIRFQGNDYHYDLYVTDTDKQIIRDVLTLYNALLK